MQSCVMCGGDTRSGSRVCAACRTAQGVDAATPIGAPLSEAEAQLAAALRSAHGHAPADADVAHTDHVTSEQHAPDDGTTGEFPAILDHVGGPEHRPTDAAEHLSELFNTPSPWDEPGQRDTSQDLAALFDRPELWRSGSAPRTAPAPSPVADNEHDVAREPQHGSHIAPQPPASDDATALEALADPLDISKPHDAQPRDTSAYPVEQWPWVTRYGDRGFWAPPATGDERCAHVEQADTAASDHDTAAYSPQEYPYTDDPRADPVGDTGNDPAGGLTADEILAADGGDAVGAEPVVAAHQVDAPDQRTPTMFTRLGGWTAVAQIALLAVGMLCVIQIFVLVVVLSYLNEGADPGGDAVGSMAAYGKIDSVMLPALFAFAVGALVLATWRGFSGRNVDGTHSQPLRLPIGLWGALAGVVALLGVILASQSTTSVADAQRITQLAIIACGVLGVSCFAAPRGLA